MSPSRPSSWTTSVCWPAATRRHCRAGEREHRARHGCGGGHRPREDAEPADWQSTLDLKLRGPMLATQLALLNVASTSGLGLAPYVSPEYGAAKAGLIRFTSTLAGLHEQMNVRVNCIVPDWIATERALAELERMTPAERAAAPVPRPPEEIADAVV
ncbi:MAG: SDR family NAD(P)-dependent oxidoreductase, partial [Leifsonia sp.]